MGVWLALSPTIAGAHTQGVSLANVSIDEGGGAKLELGLATAEINRIVPVDKDGDGQVSGPELAKVRESLTKILPGTFDLVADGKRCSAKLESAKLAEPSDGVDIVLRYTCAPRPSDVTFRSHLAPAMEVGHRLVSTLSSGTRTQSRVLTSSEPECVLHTEWEKDSKSGMRAQYALAGAVIVGIALAYAWQRRKAEKPTS